MGKTIKEIIINSLIQNNYDKKNILEIINSYGKEPISETEMFTIYVAKHLKEYKIEYMEDFLKLDTLQAIMLSGVHANTINNYIKKIKLVILKELEERKNDIYYRERIIGVHEFLEILIERITQNEVLLEYLKKDIIYQQNENNSIEKKSWLYSRLNLNKNEINILRQYLMRNVKKENIINRADIYEFCKILIKIYNNLIYYIQKLNYKTILNENYYEIESLGLSKKEIGSLKRQNIFLVCDIIEFTKKEFKEFRCFSDNKYRDILKKLEERNIVFLENENQIINNLNIENAGIIPNEKIKTLKKQKQN